MSTNIFIQARMSSSRFPGKVLAPIHGKPLIQNVIDQVNKVQGIGGVVVLTSTEMTDDPLEAYLNTKGIKVFRGDLEDVVKRFKEALKTYPCDAFIRICADSPFIDPSLVQKFIDIFQNYSDKVDLITNIFPRSFPKGQSVELMRSETFKKLTDHPLTPEQKEHVTKYFYDHSGSFNILNIKASKDLSGLSFCIDEIKDLHAINVNEAQTILNGINYEIH